MESLFSSLSKKEMEQIQNTAFPGFVEPMLATLTEDYFDDPTWIYERKLDGVRCIVTIHKGKVELFSRNRNKVSKVYPELIDALHNKNYPDLVADGEIVTFDGKTTSFSKLQNRIHLRDSKKIKDSETKVYLYLFDIMYLDQNDLTKLSLVNRKKILKRSIDWKSPIRYSVHRNEHGIDFLKEACDKNWEGIIAKNGTSNYFHSRSRNWLKFKCNKAQEMVIAGYTDPQGSRIGFGAILIGFYKNDKLLYAGKVGTGFDDEFLKTWSKKFESIEQKESPFENYDDKKNGTNHWLKPKYVAQIGFTEWTNTHKLRHPRFLGIRDDKNPKEVVKEEA